MWVRLCERRAFTTGEPVAAVAEVVGRPVRQRPIRDARAMIDVR